MKLKQIVTAIAVATLGLTANANIVSNGGFDTGDFGAWNASGWGVVTSMSGVAPISGYFAETGCVNSYCDMSQALNTTVGTAYSLSFDFNPGINVTNGGGDTKVYFGNQLVTDIYGGPAAWTNYSFSGLIATSASTTLLFTSYQNPAWNGVDNVNVTESTTSVPEPEVISLIGLGLIGLIATRRKLQKRS